MPCKKCNYKDKNHKIIFNTELCNICAHFAPSDKDKFKKYISEKIDWKNLETFRKYNQSAGEKQKTGMDKKASQGKIMTRAPFGYDIINSELTPNKDSAKLHSLFKIFLEKNYSLNSLAKNYGFSVNGLKKILTNRTYLGEIKFSGKLHKGSHKPLIAPEIFYAVQRKLKNILKTTF
jgi:hypothetical protein